MTELKLVGLLVTEFTHQAIPIKGLFTLDYDGCPVRGSTILRVIRGGAQLHGGGGTQCTPAPMKPEFQSCLSNRGYIKASSGKEREGDGEGRGESS